MITSGYFHLSGHTTDFLTIHLNAQDIRTYCGMLLVVAYAFLLSDSIGYELFLIRILVQEILV